MKIHQNIPQKSIKLPPKLEQEHRPKKQTINVEILHNFPENTPKPTTKRKQSATTWSNFHNLSNFHLLNRFTAIEAFEAIETIQNLTQVHRTKHQVNRESTPKKAKYIQQIVLSLKWHENTWWNFHGKFFAETYIHPKLPLQFYNLTILQHNNLTWSSYLKELWVSVDVRHAISENSCSVNKMVRFWGNSEVGPWLHKQFNN